ncbi:MAG: cyclic pyranopterin monophosphate synthase MoaC [Phycisphaerales bacterium]|jgi:cyclic pyranopterin phosphate synthase|nr:cyclic pyranopterin monophosphate synthase MoaC [Phycisphaerales bacterium]
MNDKLTHLDEQGRASMVDVSSKNVVRRTATASACFVAKNTTIEAIMQGNVPKGEALAVARLAGIQAAKNCGSMIPLCHPLPLECVSVSFEQIAPEKILITATTVITAKTGIEMEALAAVSAAALTLWDMSKAIDTDLLVTEIRLLEKKKESLE